MAELQLPTNQIQEFAAVLRREKWSVILPGLAGLALGLLIVGFVPRRYEAMTRVELREISVEDEPGRSAQISRYQRDVQNVGAQVLASARLDKAIAEKLKWQEYLAVRATPKGLEYLDKVRERTKVERAKKDRDIGNDYITITYKDEDPVRAANLSNALRDVWTEQSIAGYRDQVQREFNDERAKTDQAADRLRSASRAVENWQRQNDISPTQPLGNGLQIDEDFVVQQTRKAETERAQFETELASATERYNSVRAAWTAEPAAVEEAVTPDKPAPGFPEKASANEAPKSLGELQSKLQQDIALKRAEQKNKKPANKRYQVLESEIASLDKQLKELEAKLAGAAPVVDPKTGLVETPGKRIVVNQHKLDLKTEVDKAELEMNAAKSKLAVVQGRLAKLQPENEKRSEVYGKYKNLRTEQELAEKLYKEAQERLIQKQNLLARIANPAGNPFVIFDEARPAEKPVEPNLPLLLAIFAIGGFGLGFGVLFMKEFLRSSYRSSDDAAAALSIPILGAVNRVVTLREVRLEKARRVTGLSVSLSIIIVVASIGGIYLFQPKLLPRQIRGTFDSVKESLR